MATPPVLPRVTQMRQAAVAVLKAAGTFATANVFDTRLDPFDEESEFPMINVSSSTDRDTMANAGGVPVFRVTFTLKVDCGYVDADAAVAVQNADVMAQQVLDALLCDPVWIKSWMGQVATITEQKSSGSGKKTARYVSIVETTIVSKPQAPGEIYPPNTTSVLTIAGAPQASPRTVITPLTSITETLALGKIVDGEHVAGDVALTGTLNLGS